MAAVLKEPGDADLLDEILKELSVDEDDAEEGKKNKTINEDAIFYRDREPFRLVPKGAVKDDSEASVLDDTTANKVFNCKIIVPLFFMWLLLQFLNIFSNNNIIVIHLLPSKSLNLLFVGTKTRVVVILLMVEEIKHQKHANLL